jgi:hypothetical protein
MVPPLPGEQLPVKAKIKSENPLLLAIANHHWNNTRFYFI